MATANIRAQCSICLEEGFATICGGCAKTFCKNHLTQHQEKLAKELDEIENDYDEFKQRVIDRRDVSEKSVFIQEIDRWKNESNNIIEQTAQECTQQLINYTSGFFITIENQSNGFAQTLKQMRTDEFTEIHINILKQKLNKLKQELDKSLDISIERQPSRFINKIFVTKSSDKGTDCTTKISLNTSWNYNGTTVAGGNGAGYGLHQLCNPQGLYVDDDQTVYIADENNHRIVTWRRDTKIGQVVAGLNGRGKDTDQFNDPRYVFVDQDRNCILVSDTWNTRVMEWPCGSRNGCAIISKVSCSGLTMDNRGFLYITDIAKHEVRRYARGQTTGTVVAGGNGKGNDLNQLNYPTYVFVGQDHSVYVSDEYNHRVMQWKEGAKKGIIVAGGNSYGSGLTQLYNPQGVAVDEWGSVYVADMYNHRVMRWPKGASQGNIIAGGNNKGGGANQLSCPKGLSFDRQGNIYVVDNGNSRVQRFNIDPSSCL